MNDIRKYVSDDEASFSRELYMSVDQIKCMSRNGMYIGSHGYNHYWLNALPAEKQEQEIDKSLQFLSSVDAPTDDWMMAYPYGAFLMPNGYNYQYFKVLHNIYINSYFIIFI